eukprot:9285133-Karenia_brevis.AAC.1
MDPEANPCWTEHGNRSVLNGWAAELDLPKDQPDKLGRWVPEQIKDCVRAARSTVFGIRDVVSTALRNNDPRTTEEEVLDGLKEYLNRKSVDPSAMELIVQDLRWRPRSERGSGSVPATPTVSPATDDSVEQLKERQGATEGAGADFD